MIEIKEGASAEDVVSALHPYDQHTPAHIKAAAAQIAELIHYLNHATGHASALPGPDAAGEVLLSLGIAFKRLPQLIEQLANRIEAAADDPDLLNTEDQTTPGAGAELARQTADALRERLSHADRVRKSVKRATADEADAAAPTRAADRAEQLGHQLERLGYRAQRLYTPAEFPNDDE